MQEFFLIFDKKCQPITYRWLLLFIALSLKLFWEKKSFLLNQSNEIHFAAYSWAPIIKGKSNTLSSNGISLNVTLISTACPGLLADKLKKFFDGSEERGNTAMKLFPHYCHFQITSLPYLICHSPPLSFKLTVKFL